jgi:hypothetical protein
VNAIEALDIALAELATAVRNLRFSKRYALGLPEPLERLDQLETARETPTQLRTVLIEQAPRPRL